MAMQSPSAREWQDWANLLVGIWLCASPIVLGFSGNRAEMQNAVVVGFFVIVAEVLTLSFLRVVEEWINIGLGAWLLFSAWMVDIVVVAKVNSVVSGGLLIVLAIYELWDSWRTSQSPRGTRL